MSLTPDTKWCSWNRHVVVLTVVSHVLQYLRSAPQVFVAMACHVDPRTRDTNETPLFGAIKSRSMRIVRLLTEQGGCNVNASDGDGDTPLHLAVSMATHADADCFIDIARYLVRHGANALIKNQHGESVPSRVGANALSRAALMGTGWWRVGILCACVVAGEHMWVRDFAKSIRSTLRSR